MKMTRTNSAPGKLVGNFVAGIGCLAIAAGLASFVLIPGVATNGWFYALAIVLGGVLVAGFGVLIGLAGRICHAVENPPV